MQQFASCAHSSKGAIRSFIGLPTLVYAIMLFATSLMMGCGSPFLPKSSLNPNLIVAANYSSIAANILVPGCTVCHGNSGGYSFASYADTMQAVTPGNPGASMLYLAVSQGVMPKGGPNLSAEQVKAVGDWISAGAAND